MKSVYVKLKYGLTLDKNNPCNEPCPKCGAVVCHVKENPDNVFCTNALCGFCDTINHSHYDHIKDEFRKAAVYGCVYFKPNYKYSQFNHPFITEEDIRRGKFIIREFELNTELYDRIKARGGSKGSCYKENSQIIRFYANLDLLVEDGWIADKDLRIK